jgi:hypothetical protein
VLVSAARQARPIHEPDVPQSRRRVVEAMLRMAQVTPPTSSTTSAAATAAS